MGMKKRLKFSEMNYRVQSNSVINARSVSSVIHIQNIRHVMEFGRCICICFAKQLQRARKKKKRKIADHIKDLDSEILQLEKCVVDKKRKRAVFTTFFVGNNSNVAKNQGRVVRYVGGRAKELMKKI